jgi:adhesin transport system outer membrane protein
MFLDRVKPLYVAAITLAACAGINTSTGLAQEDESSVLEVSSSISMGALEQPASEEGGWNDDEDIANLKDVIKLGLKTNPEYGVVANDRLAVDHELKQARALYLPSIDLRADTGFESTDTPTIDNEDLFRNEVSLTLTQLLFDGYGTSSEVKRQKARVKSAAYRAYETAEFVALDITESFLNVLRQRFLMSIAETNVQDHIDIQEKIRFGETAGKATIGDVVQAEARLALAKANLESVKQRLTEAEDAYLRYAGNLPPAELRLPEVPSGVMSKDLEEAIHKAMLNSPTLGVFDSDLMVAKAEYEGSGSTLYPQLDIELAGSKGDNLGGIEGNETRMSSLLVMKWNLFRGGGDVARVKEFGARKKVAHDRSINARRVLEQEIRDTWAAREAAERRAENFHKQSQANKKVVQVYKDQFNMYQGRTLLDVLDAQNELFVAHSNYINAFYTRMFANFRLLALRGDLLKTIGVSPTEEAFVDGK